MLNTMKRMLVGLSAVASVGLFAAAPVNAQDQAASADVDTASTSCQYLLASSGAGEKFFRTCISTTGNVVQFRSPAGFGDAIATGAIIEGYAICDDGAGGEPTVGWHAGVHGWDSADASAGFGAPIVLAQSASSVTIRRETLDGVYRLDQKFTRDIGRREVTVQMTLTNISSRRRDQVLLSRFVDLDVDGVVDNTWDVASSSIWAARDNGVTMNATTVEVAPRTVALEKFATLSATTKRGCFLSGPILGQASGDLTGRIVYPIRTLLPGAQKTVRIVYRRQ